MNDCSYLDRGAGLLITLALATAAPQAVDAGPGAIGALCFAVAAVTLSALIAPFVRTGTWAGFAAAGCGAYGFFAAGLNLATAASVTGMALLAIVIVTGAVRLMSTRTSDAAARAAVVAIVVNLCLLPVSLGWLTERMAATPWVASVIVNVSPVTHFATWLEVDYLRTNWFYSHSRIGGLRFDYVQPVLVGACYLVLAALTVSFNRLYPKESQP